VAAELEGQLMAHWTTDEQAFRDAIVDGEESTRLIYADWLEEHGQPKRAEEQRTIAGYVRKVWFSAARDDRHPDPTKDHGVTGVLMHLILTGPHGALTLEVMTNWHLPAVEAEHRKRKLGRAGPIPAALGFHSHFNTADDLTPSDDCLILPGATCYYEHLRGEQAMFDLLRKHGDGAFWKEMRRRLDECVARVKRGGT
jgi:uncharacterized protein (TIGR02996 family)